MTFDLAKLRAETLALLDGTTPGPWMRVGWQPCGIYTAGDVSTAIRIATMDRRHEHDDNARLIAAAPKLAADNLRLLDEVERLRTALEQIAKAKYGLQSIMEDYSDTNAFNYQAMQYWRNLAQGYEATARAALAEGCPDDR